ARCLTASRRNAMSKRASTIKDVAQTAGVSTATVSNVLHGKEPLYSPETAQRVWHAVHALNYRPNMTARSLVRQRTDTLGVVVERLHGRLTRNTFLSLMLDGLMEFAVSVGYQIKIISLMTQDTARAFAQMEAGSGDGLALFAPSAHRPLLARCEGGGLPTVIAGSSPPNVSLPCVDMANEEAAYAVTRWLLGLGH